MRYRGRLIIFWLLAMLLLDATVAVLRMESGPPPMDRPTLLVMVFLALLCSQTGLLAIWIRSGRTPFLWRALAGILWAVLAGGMMERFAFPDADVINLCWFYSVQLMVIWGLLGLTRCRLARTADPLTIERKRELPSQFSVRNLLVWITALAIILGVLRSLVLLGIEFTEPKSDLIAICIIGTIFALPTLSALWAINGRRYPTLRGIQFFIVFGIVGFLILSAPDQETIYYISLMFTLELLFLAGSLMVFRLEGYRLVRRRAVRAEDEHCGAGE